MAPANQSELPTLPMSTDLEGAAALDAVSMTDTYAEHLMGELFQDVDALLESPGAIALVDPQSDDALDASPGEALIPVSTALDLPPTLTLAEQTADIAQSRFRWFQRPAVWMMGGAACMSVLLTVGLWWANQQSATQPALVPAATPKTPAELKAESDQQFLQYLGRSLEVIDVQAAEQAQATAPGSQVMPSVAVNTVPPGALPPLPGTAAANANQATAPNVIERIYVPVYQPPQTTAAAAPAPSAVAPAPATTTPANVAATVTHVLVGVLELGDRSAALFEVNGVPQRIYVGQNIAASGWTLVSVANQEAIIRRNGDVRSVFVGQQF